MGHDRAIWWYRCVNFWVCGVYLTSTWVTFFWVFHIKLHTTTVTNWQCSHSDRYYSGSVQIELAGSSWQIAVAIDRNLPASIYGITLLLANPWALAISVFIPFHFISCQPDNVVALWLFPFLNLWLLIHSLLVFKIKLMVDKLVKLIH